MMADEGEFAKAVASALQAPADATEIARLASHLASSGPRLTWPEGPPVGDVASTGGPGSLSTLLAPLWLRADGFRIVKLTVPGRPAGSIDSLGTVPGYRVRLELAAVRAAVQACGFAHFLGDGRFAPLDAAFFQFRRRTGSVAVPQLAIASILAKKVAVEARFFGLDVRVGPHGNFGRTRDEARRNAVLMRGAAKELGVEAVIFLSTEGISQPLIGRGEALVGLAHALGLRQVDDADSWLAEHLQRCRQMAAELRAAPNLGRDGPPASMDEARHALDTHLSAQGSSMRAFLERVDQVLASERFPILADSDGLLDVDIARLRDALVAAQDQAPGADFQDAAGVKLLVRPGSYVSKGDVVATVRTAEGREGLIRELGLAFRVADIEPATSPAADLEVIRG